MIWFSTLLKSDPANQPAADTLLAALDLQGIPYRWIPNTKAIWARDYMPVKTGTGRYISFRYEPGYLEDYPEKRTDFPGEVSDRMGLSGLVYSDINLDGGNVVLSPSKRKAIVSDRIFSENPGRLRAALIKELEQLLEAEVIIIPSLSPRNDMTGHADGMVRFLDEDTVLGNCTSGKYTLEKRIAAILAGYGIATVEFPYFDSRDISAEGCYLNYLETDDYIFLPVFSDERDGEAIRSAVGLFSKTVVPVCIPEIAKQGGCLNCISWED